jgi:hypothetical protein
MLGNVNEGVHKWHIGPFAVADTLLTIILAICISKWLKINFLISFSFFFVLGELMHIIFGVQTTFLSFLKIKINCI